MAKFKKFDPQEHIRGLAAAARQVRAEELIRAGKMPDLETVLRAAAETREKYAPLIEEARTRSPRASGPLLPDTLQLVISKRTS